MFAKMQGGVLVVAVMALVAVAARAEGLQITTLAGTAGTTGMADGTGAAAQFNLPSGVATDSAGNIYVADKSNHTIRKVTPTGDVTTLAGTAGASGSQDGDGTAALFNYPHGVAVDSGLNVYVADSQNNTIRVIAPDGSVRTLAGLAGTPGSRDGTGSQASFNNPEGVAVDADLNVYVGDTGNHTIRKVTPAGVVTTLAGTAGTAGSADGTGTAAQFNGPGGVAVDKNGNIYVADTGNHTIRVVTSTGGVTTLAGNPLVSDTANGTGGLANFITPHGVAVDNAGNILVADEDSQTIRMVTPAGVVTTLAGLGGSAGSDNGAGIAARFFNPAGVAVDGSNGNVYVADSANDTIRKGVAAPSDALRIELNWDVPCDLDLFVKEPALDANGQPNVVSFENQNSLTGGTYPIDVIGGTGPEMVYWTNLPGGTFEFWVANTSGTDSVSFIINVYENGKVVQTVTGVFSTGTEGEESTHATVSVLGANSGADGVPNIAPTGAAGEVTNPIDGFGMTVANSNGGVVELALDDQNLINKSAYDASTDFLGIGQALVPGGSKIPGYSPAAKFTSSGLYVAEAALFSPGDTTIRKGHGRLMLAVSQREIDGTTNYDSSTAFPRSITPKSLRAKLDLTGAAKARADTVTFSGLMELPVGLKLPSKTSSRAVETMDLAVGIGNIIDHLAVDYRGRTINKSKGDAGNVKSVSVKFPKPDRQTGLTFGTTKQRLATVTVTLSKNAYVANGFDTEGVSGTPKASTLKIQTAIMLAGITYQNRVTVGIKVTKKRGTPDSVSLTQTRAQ